MPSRTNGRLGALVEFHRTAVVFTVSVAIAGAMSAASLIASTAAEAKTPGKTYCFLRKCHRVMTLEETRRAVGQRIILTASHYDDPSRDRFNPRNLTSSGEMFRASAPDNAASPKLPNGTIILAWNPATKQAAVLRINNAGPYWGNRTLDVSRGAAVKLGFAGKGIATLHTRILEAPTLAEATYRKGRHYAAVPGPIGVFATLELAAAASAGPRGMPAPVTPVATIAVASLPVAPHDQYRATDPVTIADAPVVTSSLIDAEPADAIENAGSMTTAVPAQTAAPIVAAIAAPVVKRKVRIAPVAARPARTKIILAASRHLVAANDLIARAPRSVRRPITAAGNRAPECQGWAGACTVTVSRSAIGVSRTRVASSSKRQ